MAGMAGVSVLVPLAGDESRVHLWRWLRRHHWEHRPHQVIVGSDSSPRFSKGRALSHAYRDSWHDVLVLSDADCLIQWDYLDDAIARVARGVPWVVPFATVHRLNPHATQRIMNHSVATTDEEMLAGVYRTDREAVIGGGTVVLSREAYETVHGIDPRFEIWGAEVDSFGWALRTLVGDPVQLNGTLWHFHHQYPEGRREAEPELNKCLGGAYRDAFEAKDTARMRRLCDRQEACA